MTSAPTLSAEYDRHIPVLLSEVLTALGIRQGERHVDGTFGAGGYSVAMAKAGASVFSLDRDPDAIAEGRAIADANGVTLIAGEFSRMQPLLAEAGVEQVSGVTLDIGVSSMQLDRADRGFSVQADGPLLMTMSQQGENAGDFLNNASEEEIANVLYLYGDEKRSYRVARAIVGARPLTRTSELASVVRRALGYKPHDKKDPAIRIFQAIRIRVNRELDELEQGLEAAEAVLEPGGRLAVVTFHSLEDRIVKNFLRKRSGGEGQGSRHMPAQAAGPAPTFEKPAKAVRPGEAELARNPRARSATLRSAVRTAAPVSPVQPPHRSARP